MASLGLQEMLYDRRESENPMNEQNHMTEQDLLKQTIGELEMRVKELQEQLGLWTQATSCEPHRCELCGKWFLRRKKVSHAKRFCDSKKCQKIVRLGKEKPVGFEGIPSGCSPFRADIDYHGSVMA
ncbi:MAG TPA: hypothetical protein VNZ22_12270 [Bacillota bacterium]|nr:hypothetical protein [Bacillota bacterium]